MIGSTRSWPYRFPIVQNPTSRGVFWTIGWNLRSEVLTSFVSNFVSVVFLVESEWPLAGYSRAEFVFCQTSLAGSFSAGEILA
jgi:hypothetical protein